MGCACPLTSELSCTWLWQLLETLASVLRLCPADASVSPGASGDQDAESPLVGDAPVRGLRPALDGSCLACCEMYAWTGSCVPIRASHRWMSCRWCSAALKTCRTFTHRLQGRKGPILPALTITHDIALGCASVRAPVAIHSLDELLGPSARRDGDALQRELYSTVYISISVYMSVNRSLSCSLACCCFRAATHAALLLCAA